VLQQEIVVCTGCDFSHLGPAPSSPPQQRSMKFVLGLRRPTSTSTRHLRPAPPVPPGYLACGIVESPNLQHRNTNSSTSSIIGRLPPLPCAPCKSANAGYDFPVFPSAIDARTCTTAIDCEINGHWRFDAKLGFGHSNGLRVGGN